MSKVADKPKRRWWLPRWSMASMFVMVTVVCVVLGLVVRHAEQQKAAVEALRSLEYFNMGSVVLYDYELDRHHFGNR